MLSISRPGPKAKRALFFMASDSVVLALNKKNSLKWGGNLFSKSPPKTDQGIPFGLCVGLEAKLQDGYEHGQD